MILLFVFIIVIFGLLIYFTLRNKNKKKKSQILQVPQPSEISFNVMQYNIQFDPTAYLQEGALERSRVISTAISRWNGVGNIDVITFCEGFVNKARETLIYGLKQFGWKYSTQVVNAPLIIPPTNGGVFIVSKWPIIKETQMVFKNSSGSDALAAKGVMYARIQKPTIKGNKIFNVFATHLQAWDTQEGKKIRIQQIAELAAFVNNQKIPLNEPIIYTGDFNADYIKNPQEIQNLARILHAKIPRMINEQKYTSDPATNTLVGQDGADAKCHDDYYCHVCFSCKEIQDPQCVARCRKMGKKPADGSKWWCPCCPQEYLDYILYNEEHQQPVREPTIQVVSLKSFTPLKFPSWHLVAGEPFDKPNLCTTDMSDHYPVFSRFWFPLPTEPVHIPDGCKNDDDCHYKPFSTVTSCYCTGPGCTYNGKKVNGWDLGGKHPVNKNCHLTSGLYCVCKA